MDEPDNERWTIPASRYPSPVCAVGFDGGTPVVERVNDAFETVFEPVDTGTRLTAALDSLGATDPGDETLAATLTAEETFTVTVEKSHGGDRRYRVQPVSTADGGVTLVFTEATDDAVEGQFGVENVASVVSHELRNPLDVARTRLRAGRELDEEGHFEHVERAHERMERIIQDVLTLARGSDAVDPDEPVALGRVARTAWETVETGDATLTVEEPLPTAQADPDRVARLFENLFRNSVEHGPAGRRSATEAEPIRVTVGPVSRAPTAGFFVADTGGGVPEGERDRVFEPGYSSDEHGTGLGLAIVERIATLHGWSCRMTTAEGGGARVEVRGVEPASQS